jgi:MFS transporter, DHA2 family, multidrug resistance protein
VTAPVLLPEFRDPHAGRLDLASVALSLATLLPVIYGLKEIAKHGLGIQPVVAVVVGAAFGVAFARRQRRLPHPLMDLRLFANRSFSAALAIMLLATVTMGGIFLFASQYLQLVEGLSPLQAGLWLVPPTVVMIASSLLSPAVARRVRPGFALAGALVLGAAGFALISLVPSIDGVLALVIAMGVTQIGWGPLGALCTELVVSSAPPEKAGSASAMSETSGEFGIAMGVATLGSIGTAIYRGQISGTMPAGLPAEAATAAGDTLAGAVAAAGQLPAGVAGELLAAAREAFTSGMNTVAAGAAVVTLLFAVLAVVTLRHLRPGGQDQPEQKVEAAQTETVEAVA